MNEAITKIKQGAKKVLALAKGSLPPQEARLLVAQDIKREVMQEFEVFY